MVKRILGALTMLFFCVILSAQVTTTPAFIAKGYKGEIVITFDPVQGNGGMKNAKECYAHTGLITKGSASDGDWKYATKWRGGEEKYKLTKSGSVWTLRINNIYDYYGCPEKEEILKIAFVFNDGPNGSKEGKTADGKDIFIELVEGGLNVKIEQPNENLLVKPGDKVAFKISASEESDISLLINGKEAKSSKGTSLNCDYTFAKSGDYSCIAKAMANGETEYDTVAICALGEPKTATRPTGLRDGITYYKNEPSKATLSLYSKDKSEKTAQTVFVLGDFNGWTFSNNYQMNKDGETGYFWLDINGLEPGKEYAFQYAVKRADGTMVQISDPYTEKTTDEQDKYIPEDIYPNKLTYPAAAQGPTAVLQTAQKEFSWSDATINFKRPDKNNLIIYEVWVYDFSPLRSIEGLTHRLDYIENLGVNAIELMPVSEFEGNISWGYNPTHYFAFDKAYGTKEMFKYFIDECHKRGIAVIMDMVFNHSTGLNPMNKMYPLANNPYFNTRAPHDGNVFEDFNHEFDGTLNHFTRVLNFWLEEYKIDGYRMDLSHGLCGPDCNEQKRIMYHYFNEGVKKVDPNAYFILEHWDSNRNDYASNGMMCWENTNNAYSQTAMGWLKDGDNLNPANKDNYVSYAESHDEERNFYKAKEWGKDNIKTDETVRMNRIAANVAMNIFLNGPQMMWMFEELGYDYSINENDRTGTKPMPELLGFYKNALRMAQYQKIGQMNQLRTRILPQVFVGDPKNTRIGSGVDVRNVTWGEGVNAVFIASNLSTADNQEISLPDNSNKWYEYLADSKTEIKAGTKIRLRAGEVKVFTAQYYKLPNVPIEYNYTDYTAVETPEFENLCTVYPTITDGELNIETDVEIKSVAVYSMLGETLLRKDAASQINISGLNNGMYLLVVTFDNKQEAFKIYRR